MLENKRIIEVNADDLKDKDLQCECGSYDDFYPIDENGEYIDDFLIDDEEMYKCDRCQTVYKIIEQVFKIVYINKNYNNN